MHIHFYVEHIRSGSDVFTSSIFWFRSGFYCWVSTSAGKMIVFSYLFEKKNCFCEAAWAGVSAPNPECSITAPLWNSWCAWLWPLKFRWQSQCSWGTWGSEFGSVLLWNISYTQQKQRVEAILCISRRKPLLKRRAWSVSEKQPLPIKILPHPKLEGF